MKQAYNPVWKYAGLAQLLLWLQLRDRTDLSSITLQGFKVTAVLKHMLYGLFLIIDPHTYSFTYYTSCLWYHSCAVCKWVQGQQKDRIDRTIIQFKNMQLDTAAIIYCKVLWLLVEYSCQWYVSYTVSNNNKTKK